jgi:glycosyltransferase involved in cell wall biosynthesis
MKIAFIGQKGIPGVSGGVEKHVEHLATKLAEKNHDVFVYVRNNYTAKNIKEYKGVKLIHLPSLGTKHLDAISHTFLASVHAIFQDYDVIHYQAIGPTSLSFLVKIFKPRAALIATFHCQDYFHQKWGWFARNYLKLAEYITCNVPDRTITVSNVLGTYVKRAYRQEAKVIPNGASVTLTSESDLLSEWGIEKNGYILSQSRLIKHKGIHYLIEAFKNLEDKNLTHGKKLVIVGDGFYTDDYVNYLKVLAVGSKNIVFTGAQTGRAMDQLFANAYLFVHPSDSEGLSITLLEVMAHGKAVLSSDIPENVEPLGGNGFYFRSGNTKDLENKLLKLLDNPTILEEAGKNAQQVARNEYSWEKIANKTEHLYREVLLEKAKHVTAQRILCKKL